MNRTSPGGAYRIICCWCGKKIMLCKHPKLHGFLCGMAFMKSLRIEE